MPNRIIKESICTSENIDSLSLFAEVTFYRLMVNADDFGRFDARIKILASRLFPLKEIPTEKMEKALSELVNADLVTVYFADGKPFLYLNSWDKHQQKRARNSKYPSPNDTASSPSDINCNQMISDDIKCPRESRIENRETRIENRESDSGIGEDEAAEILSDHNRILDAAEDAGFQKTNSVRARLIDLYAAHGLQKVLDGINSCVTHGAPNLAYLEACMKDQPKKKPGTPSPATQEYEQRDYSGKDREALDRMLAMMGG